LFYVVLLECKIKILKKIKIFKIENKSCVWFAPSNNYVIVEHLSAEILDLIDQNKSINEIINILNLSDDFVEPITHLKEQLYLPNTVSTALQKAANHIESPAYFAIIKYYKIGKLIYKVAYQTEYLASLVHPKFGYLETEEQNNYTHYFEVSMELKIIYLKVNDAFIGSWPIHEEHYFQGKFSMKLTETLHQKPEKEWLGVFHASALSYNQKAVLILGDSGNGKSTSLALLQAHGFQCLADDFVPVLAKNQKVYSFPQGISIKKNSLPILLPLYPELIDSAEYYFKKFNKTVRYLKPNNPDFTTNETCEDLIFIKYQKDSGMNCQKISKIEAFNELIPDSWLSPELGNVKIFMDWFNQVNCYRITYSNNPKMIDAVKNILSS